MHWWHTLTDVEVAVVVVQVVLGIWLRHTLLAIALGIVCVVAGLRRTVACTAVVAAGLAIVLSNAAWRGVAPDHLGPFAGSACLISDPAPKQGALVVVFEIDGERFESWARGSPRRRIEPHLAGECATLRGTRRALTGVALRRVAISHIVGGLTIESVGDWTDGSRFDRASNRVRRLFADGSGELPTSDDALFAGLVIGDDRNEPDAMIDEFRRSGLSHLTAVSGQNVAYVLAAAAPLLRRLRPWMRWTATLAVIGWFVALTRFEPSVLRAGVMAAIAATGFVLGREKPPGRVLALAVGVLVLADPLLVWSVGFWLSVFATAGVALLSGRLATVVPGPDWFAMPMGVTLAAQVGVAPVSLLVFGSLPLVSLPANLLAVPVAGAVMLYGLPAGLIAGALHGDGLAGSLATLIQTPSVLGTRWVATVAALAARLEPPGAVAAIGWVLVVLAIAAVATHRFTVSLSCTRVRRCWLMALHLITGDDESLVHAAVTELVHRLVGSGDRTLMVDDFGGDEYELRSVVDAAQTMPFLTDKRIVVARDIGRFNADDAAPLVAYLGDPLPSSDLILVAGGGRMAKSITDALKKAGATTSNTTPPTSKRDRSAWIEDQVVAAGMKLDPGALARVATWMGEEAGRLAGVLDTLESTYGTGKKLSVADIEPFLGESGSVPPWDLTDAIDRGDTKTSLELLARMMQARHPLVVMATLHSHYVKMMKVDGTDADSEAAVAAVLGIKPGFPARKVLDQYRRIGGAGVARAVALLAGADLDLRGQRELPEELVMEVLVARLSRLAPAVRAGRR